MKTLMTIMAVLVLGSVAQASPKKTQAPQNELATEDSIFELAIDEKLVVKRLAAVLTTLSDEEQFKLIETLVSIAREKQASDEVVKTNTLGNPFPGPAPKVEPKPMPPEFTRPMFMPMPLSTPGKK